MSTLRTENLQSFPDLPVDIARRILEASAIDDRVTALSLVCVSKAVRAWIDPILFETIVIDSRKRLDAVLLSLELRNDPAFFSTHVKRVCVWARLIFDQAKLSRLMPSLSGVVSLAWWCSQPLPVGNVTRPKYLFLADSIIPFSNVVSPNLTHMNLGGRDLYYSSWPTHVADMDASSWFEIFARCPALTHLMFNLFDAPDALVEREVALVVEILSVAPPTFKVFILLIAERPLDWVGDAFSDVLSDSRCMVIDTTTGPSRGGVSYENYFHYDHDPTLDWQYMPTSRMTVWEFADLQLRRRATRRGVLALIP
ncbi:hypothetical protein BDZ89DRAFT_1161624 [Hymenopellis radicata]|nr:hypothetical protein BDZ89DRAFT_1161624 [Hymenopellis radicata]